MLDNNFDNNEELEIVNITEDESKAEEEVKEEKKTTDRKSTRLNSSHQQ